MRPAFINRFAATAFTEGFRVDGGKISLRWDGTAPASQTIAIIRISPWLGNIDRTITITSEQMLEQA